VSRSQCRLKKGRSELRDQIRKQSPECHKQQAYNNKSLDFGLLSVTSTSVAMFFSQFFIAWEIKYIKPP
jgi:hypothetical protein